MTDGSRATGDRLRHIDLLYLFWILLYDFGPCKRFFWQGGRACRRGCVKALPEKQVVRLVAGSVAPRGALAKGVLVHGHISDSSAPRNADRRCPAARFRAFL